jgi:PAS domain S-box-containing protein
MNTGRAPPSVGEDDLPRAQGGENKSGVDEVPIPRAEKRNTERASYTKALQERVLQLAFGAAMAVLVVVGILAYRSVLASNDSSAWVRHTLEVLENLEDVQLAMETIVESARGFVLTGDETYLERYRATTSSLTRHQAAVRSLTTDNPEQQRTFSALEKLTAERMQRADLNISLRRTQGFAAAEDAIRSQPAERAATDFLAIVSKMQSEERSLLAIRDADTRRHSSQTNAILFFGIVLGLLITGTAFWCVQRDNSRRWLAESALRDSEEQYRLLIKGVKDYAIFMLDPKGNVGSWNEGAERIKGYKADEIVGKHFSVFYPPEDLAKEKPAGELIQAAAEGKFEEEGRRLRKDGSHFWAHVLITPVRRGNGELRGFSKVTQDITERKNAEVLILEQIQELRRSVDELEQFRVLVKGVKDYAIFMLDPNGDITTWNEGAERIKGYKASEIIGQHFSRFYTSEDLATGKPSRELVEAVAQGKYEEEGSRVRKDGSRFWANVIIIPLLDEKGELRGFSKITRDITARKTAEALL